MLRTFFAPKSGDAFVIAPDGSRAGLKWEASDKPYFQEIMPVETCIASHYGMGRRQACPFLTRTAPTGSSQLWVRVRLAAILRY